MITFFKPFSRGILTASVAALLLQIPLLAQAIGTSGVPVTIQVSAYGRAESGEPAEIYAGASGFVPTDPATGEGASVFAEAARYTSTYGWYVSSAQTGMMEPGRVYAFAVNGFRNTANKLTLAAPAGYTLEIDGTIQHLLQKSGNAATYLVRLLAPLDDFSGKAGTASSIASGLIHWQVALGSLANGNSARSLAIVDAGKSPSWSSLFTPAGLHYQETSAEVSVLRVSNAIRQIIAPGAAVDVVTLTSTSYKLLFYNRSAVVGTSGLRTFSGSPFVTYLVEPGATATTLKITSTTRDLATSTDARVAVTTLQRSGTWPNYTWSLQDWRTNGQTALSEEVRTPGSGNTTAARSETAYVRVPGGATATQTVLQYNLKPWGEVVASTTQGGTDSITTTYDYYTASAEDGSYRSVKSITRNDGTWETYDYYAAFPDSPQVGTVKQRYRPYLNSPVTLGFDPNQGEVTYYEYANDPFGRLTRPTLVRTTVNTGGSAVVVAKFESNYTEQAFTQNNYAFSLVTATSQNHFNASGGKLQTVTKYFRENTADEFFRGNLHSVLQPNGVKQAYAYQRGSWNGTAFTKSGNNGLDAGDASRVTVITGTAGSGYTTHEGYDIDDLNLVSGKSTMEVTIRDLHAWVVRTESHVWNGTAWSPVASTTYAYDAAGFLTERLSSNGAKYTASYKGEQRQDETDESGVTISYQYDVAGRVSKATKTSGPHTTFGYDAGDRVVSESLAATGTSEHIDSARTYDDAGRLKTETPSGLGTTTYTYNVGNRQRTATFPEDSATRTETYLRDGKLDKVEGSAVVSEYYSYGVETDGRQRVQVYSGSSGSARWQKNWVDCLGRATRTERPGFSVTSQSSFVEENFYHATTGLLERTDRTGYASTRYAYDALGQLSSSGLDLGNNGLVANSADRITDTDTFFESYSGAWWLTRQTKAYRDGSGTPFVASTSRQRLTGHPANRLDETQVTDAEGNTTVRTVEVNRATRTVTVTTVRPGLASNQVETIVNGLATSAVTHDGLTVSSQYDALARLWKQTDPRGKVTTTAYKSGTPLVETVTDPAGNAASQYYDNRGRKVRVTDATNHSVRYAYNQRSQLTYQWGDGAYPVSYGYDSTFGDRTSLHTFRGAPAADSSAWPSGGPADTTTFAYDGATGLLWKKTDASSKYVEYTYNQRGQTHQRFWSRTLPGGARVTATYGYDGSTGELTGITYNDSTPAVSYSYTRLGQLFTVGDFTGSRTYNYDASKPWRLGNVALPAFYGSRFFTALYDSTGMVGRSRGFQVGSSAGSAADLEQSYGFTSGGRFETLASKRANNGVSRTFRYGYLANTAFVETLSIDGGHAFTITRGYDPNRNLLTSIDAKWSGTSRTRFEYGYNTLAQRNAARQSGDAFADYGDATFSRYSYNARGELTAAPSYLGGNVADTSKPLPGRQQAYGYDSIGNRKWADRTGNLGRRESFYADAGATQEGANNLNQYVTRENDTVPVQGNVDSVNTQVAVAGAVAPAGRQGRFYAAEARVANSGGPWQGDIKVFAAKPGQGTGGLDLARSDLRTVQVAKALQYFTYDNDGNLLTDGIWDYQWDAENRLVRMATTGVAATAGLTNRVLEFRYDSLGRRVQKRVLNGANSAELSSRRFLYGGWNVLMEFEAPGGTSLGSVVRSFTWGLDLTGSLTASGGVGALIQIRDEQQNKTLLPTYDGNGNVAALLNADNGGVEAAYEYDPFGNLLRAEGLYAKANPFRFSTKWQDDETGLINYGVRYYSAALGRFINRDPIAEQGGLNLYGFCGNDGINHWDYLGQSWLSKVFKKIGKWISDHKREILTVVAIAASIFVGYQVAALVQNAMTTSAIAAGNAATSAALAAGAPGMAALQSGSFAISNALVGSGVISGIAGGAAGGAVAGGIMTGTLKGALQGAAAGAIMGGIAGYYGRAWNMQRVAATSVGGGLASEVSGGSFRQGALLSGGISLVTYGAIKMSEFTVAQSKLDPLGRNASGDSVGANGNGFKAGGGRFDERVNMIQRESPLGGIQGGQGLIKLPLIGRVEYASGSFLDRVVEAYSGVHDWLNNPWSYNPTTGNFNPPVSLFGRYLGGSASGVASLMNWVDVPLATPIVAASVAGIYAPNYVSIYNQSQGSN